MAPGLAVLDSATDRPAEMGIRTIVGLNRQHAEKLAELLNKLNARRPEPKT